MTSAFWPWRKVKVSPQGQRSQTWICLHSLKAFCFSFFSPELSLRQRPSVGLNATLYVTTMYKLIKRRQSADKIDSFGFNLLVDISVRNPPHPPTQLTRTYTLAVTTFGEVPLRLLPFRLLLSTYCSIEGKSSAKMVIPIRLLPFRILNFCYYSSY